MPTPQPLTCRLAGETLHLHPERALVWPEQRTVFVADVHFGKAASFRAAGALIPCGTTAKDLTRLGRVLDRSGAERLVILGDLFHARIGRRPETMAAVAAFRERYAALEWLLVRGNHDRAAGDPPAQWGVRCVDPPFDVGPFRLCHEPSEALASKAEHHAAERGPRGEHAGKYGLCGHLHPKVQLVGAGDSVRLPAFWFGPSVGVLPAFTEFAAGACVRPQTSDRVYVVADGDVIDVSPPTAPPDPATASGATPRPGSSSRAQALT